MEWLEIAKAVGEFGILTVIAAIFLYQNKKDRDERDRQNQTFFEAQMEQNKQLFAKMMEGNGTSHILSEKEDAEVSELDKNINDYLEQVLAATKASRAFIMRYHNGGRDMTNTPFLRLSMTNEVIKPGYSPVTSEFQNQFRSILAIICESVSSVGQSFIDDVDDIKYKDSGTYELLHGRGVKSIYSKPLRSINGHVIGFVSVVYLIDNNVEKDLTVINNELEAKSRNISALLSLRG